MEKLYLWEENFDSLVNDEKICGSGYESIVYKLDDKVLKILQPEFRNRHMIKRISKLSERIDLKDLITLPLELTYLDMHFIGFTMNYEGENVRDYAYDNNIPIDERIDILIKIKEKLV